jgi:hypothetical protein
MLKDRILTIQAAKRAFLDQIQDLFQGRLDLNLAETVSISREL